MNNSASPLSASLFFAPNLLWLALCFSSLYLQDSVASQWKRDVRFPGPSISWLWHPCQAWPVVCEKTNFVMLSSLSLLTFFILGNEGLSYSEVYSTDLGFKLKIWGSVGNFSFWSCIQRRLLNISLLPRDGWRINQLSVNSMLWAIQKRDTD